jgi:hypothetical protein
MAVSPLSLWMLSLRDGVTGDGRYLSQFSVVNEVGAAAGELSKSTIAGGIGAGAVAAELDKLTGAGGIGVGGKSSATKLGIANNGGANSSHFQFGDARILAPSCRVPAASASLRWEGKERPPAPFRPVFPGAILMIIPRLLRGVFCPTVEPKR